MNATENKEIAQAAYTELAKGNGKPFLDLLGDDIRWRIIGTTEWSGTWEGKEAVRRDLLDPLFAQFATPYRNKAIRLVAEDDYVVIECRGDVTTKSGRPYRNTYCYVCRFEGGKVRELTEYCDTELLTKVLTPPRAVAA
jgi:uncharacterized protein